MFNENENVNATLDPQGVVAPTEGQNNPVKEPETTPEEPELLEGTVADCVRLNVRKEPAANAPVVCTIPRNTKVVVVEEESTDEFYKVYTESGIEGFCMKQYISIEA